MKALTLIKPIAKLGSLIEEIDRWQVLFCSGATHSDRARANDMRWLRAKVLSLLGEGADIAELTIAFCQELKRLQTDKPSTIKRRRATHQRFCKYLRTCYPTFMNPFEFIAPPKAARKKPKWFTEDEEKALREVRVGKTMFARMRNLLVLELGMSLGLRREEIVNLDFRQMDSDLRYLRDVRGKGDRYDDIFLPDDLRELVTVYLKLRELELVQRGISPTPDVPLVVSVWEGDPRMSTEQVYHLAVTLGEIAGVEGCHPHRWRHTAIRRCLEATNFNLNATREFARHTNIEMTSRYCMSETSEVEEAATKMSERRRLNTTGENKWKK